MSDTDSAPSRPDGGYAASTGRSSTADNRPLRQLWTVTVTEYRLAVRSRWALALTGLFVIFGAMLGTFSGSAVGPAGADRVVASLTSLTVYLVPLAALAFGYDAIVGHQDEGWLEVVFSLPVTRARVVLGTFFGRAIVLAGATILGFGFVGVLLLREYGASYWSTYVVFLGGAVSVGLVFLGVALLISTLAREKTHALGLALLVWLWFVLLHDLLALGVVATFDLPDIALTAVVALNPATVFRVLVLSQLGISGGGGFAAAFATTSLSTGVLLTALATWTLGPVAASTVLIRRRRL